MAGYLKPDAVRSRIMASVRGKDTGPERVLRSALHARGLRYRKHSPSVPGRPDLSISSRRVAVFIDGCFWHGCPKHYRTPSRNAQFWDSKIARNQQRRREVLSELRRAGWRWVQVRECDLKARPGTAIARVWRAVTP